MNQVRMHGKRLTWLPLLGVLVGILVGLGGGYVYAADIQCKGGLCQGTTSNDFLNGTNKADEIYGYAGHDRIYGHQGGPDELRGGNDADLIEGNPGYDKIEGDWGNDAPWVITGYGLFGGDEIDDVYGYRGEDYLDSGNDNDVDDLFGGDHDDILWSADGSQDYAYGGDGTDYCLVDKYDIVQSCISE